MPRRFHGFQAPMPSALRRFDSFQLNWLHSISSTVTTFLSFGSWTSMGSESPGMLKMLTIINILIALMNQTFIWSGGRRKLKNRLPQSQKQIKTSSKWATRMMLFLIHHKYLLDKTKRFRTKLLRSRLKAN